VIALLGGGGAGGRVRSVAVYTLAAGKPRQNLTSGSHVGCPWATRQAAPQTPLPPPTPSSPHHNLKLTRVPWLLREVGRLPEVAGGPGVPPVEPVRVVDYLRLGGTCAVDKPLFVAGGVQVPGSISPHAALDVTTLREVLLPQVQILKPRGKMWRWSVPLHTVRVWIGVAYKTWCARVHATVRPPGLAPLAQSA
jgi:hypothetical protein